MIPGGERGEEERGSDRLTNRIIGEKDEATRFFFLLWVDLPLPPVIIATESITGPPRASLANSLFKYRPRLQCTMWGSKTWDSIEINTVLV